jgi:hypothetical protein
MVLSGTAKEIDRNGKIKDVPFKAIPYSTWNNRVHHIWRQKRLSVQK